MNDYNLKDDGFFRYFQYLKDDTCLRPCPFCWSAPRIEQQFVERIFLSSLYKHSLYYNVFCDNCYCRQGMSELKSSVVKAWNERS